MSIPVCRDYTLAKEWPLTQEQNELIDFGIRRANAVLSGQAGIRCKLERR